MWYIYFMELFRELLEFEWDAGNREKNLLKHRVANAECEEAFFDPHKRVLKEVLHSGDGKEEKRHIMIGRTKADRALFVVFTLRKNRVRVISARDLHKKERELLP